MGSVKPNSTAVAPERSRRARARRINGRNPGIG